MYKGTKSYFQAIAALVGTTIGAGIFGVPYIMAQAGPIAGMFWIVVLGFLLTITHLLHGEFSLRSSDDLRFVGIARKYLSRQWGIFAGVLTIVGYYGALLAYIILGGTFLNTLLGPVWGDQLAIATLIYFVGTGLILLDGIQFLKKIELPLTLGLLFALVGVSVYLLQWFDVSTLPAVRPQNVLLPYGVVLFSLSAISAIPTIEDILGKNKHELKRVIITSGVISAFVVLLFGLAIVGVTGTETAQDAISGLSASLGNGIIYLGAIIGFLAVITSHLVIAHHLKEIYHFDYKFPKMISWGLAVILPYIIFLLARVEFIAVIGFIGAVIGGITGNLVGYISLKSHTVKTREPEYCLKYDRFWAMLVMIIFSLGIVYQLYYSIVN